MSSLDRRFLCALAALVLGLLCGAGRAVARPTVAVLQFGGDSGAAARRQVVRALQRSYRVVGSDSLLAACEELGISMSRGENLARACQHIGAKAVVGGSTGGGRIAVAVYSGRDGEVVAKGAFRWPRDLARARRMILRALKKVPAPAEPTASPDSDPGHTDPGTGDLGPGEGDPATGGGGNGAQGDPSLNFDPDEVRRGGEGDIQARESEDPLAQERRRKAAAEAAAAAAQKKAEHPREDPAVLGYLGFGTWMRTFTLNDPANDGVRRHPRYDSGATLTFQVTLRAWPLAFLLEGFPAGWFVRMRYQTVIGLTSAAPSGAGDLSTSMSELMLDTGYDFKLWAERTAPHVDINVGYGTLNFAIDWGGANPTLPSAAYSYLAAGAGLRWPFADFIGLHIRADYRFVFGTGEIEGADPDRWYGPSSTGGLAGAAGLHGSYKGFIASAEYGYTRFFYTFDQAQARQAGGQRAAGGALDQFHGVMVGLGYSY